MKLTQVFLALAALLVDSAAPAQLNFTRTADGKRCQVAIPAPGTKQKRGQFVACPTMRTGVNLAEATYYGTSHPFLDRFKTSDPWIAAPTYQPVPLDAAGDPLPGPAEFRAPFDVDPWTSDYVLTFRGDMDVFVPQATKAVTVGPGRVILTIPAQQYALLVMTPNGGPDASPHDVHIVRADQEKLLAAGQVLNPAYVALSSVWKTLRVMDWNRTNVNQTVRWADRVMPANPRWTTVPYEIQIRMANEANTDLWFNIAPLADDDHVRRAVQLIHDTLDPKLRVHLELANETWNWGFVPTTWYQTIANGLWAGQPGASTYDKNGVKNLEGGNLVYYGYRAAQVAAIARDVYRDRPKALRMVVSTQTAWRGIENYTFDGVARAKLGAVDALFDEYAVTTYFGGWFDNGGDADVHAKVVGWAKGGAAGLDAAFSELNHGASFESLANLRSTLAYQAGVAKARGLVAVAYEGGIHLVIDYYGDDRAVVLDLFNRMLADRRMGLAYQRMWQEAADVGLTEIEPYNDVQDSLWGQRAYPGAPTPRDDALRALAR